MFLVKLLRQVAVIYAVLLMVDFIIPFASPSRSDWMDWVHRICEPGVRLGNTLADQLFPDRQFKIDVGPLVAMLMCWVIKWVLGWFL